jgi:hypothetical protein
VKKTIEKPDVSFPSTVNDNPKPIFSENDKRKSVDATQNVKLLMVRLVWSFLRIKSFIGKNVSLI